jgi:hypothetical protein
MNPQTFPILLMVPAVLLAAPAAVPAQAAPNSAEDCADINPSMGLGPFAPEAETQSFFYGTEGVQGSFRVQWTGIACGRPDLMVDAVYSGIPGSAGPSDYSLPPDRTPKVCEVPSSACSGGVQTIDVSIPGSPIEEESVVEAFTIALSNPQGGTITPPDSAPFLIVDGDGEARVAFDDLSYSRSESFATMTIPVWRAGSATGPVTVPYTVGPGSSATENNDFAVTSPNPLSFGAGERVKVITLSIVNDEIGEGDETVELSLQAPTGAALDTPSTKVVTIEDNEENIAPTSRFHHPRHKWKYKKSDYRIREFHVFAHDEEGGSGVVSAEIALRRKLMNGKCAWKMRKGWQRKDCDKPTWLPTKYDETGDLFYYRMPQLKSSVKTKVKNYTAFSRAIDGAGNIEKDLIRKRNDNTFEIKRTKKRR